MSFLQQVTLRGFKTLANISDLELGRMNVLIGANGAGKSNFISFFRMLSWMTANGGNLQLHIGRTGGANALLHDGADVTPQMLARLTFQTDAGRNEYELRLFHAAGDTLVFAEEKLRYTPNQLVGTANWMQLGAGHKEAAIIEVADRGNATAKFMLGLLQGCKIYQFHNTSETARMRQRWSAHDNQYLKEDGANLGSFLLHLRETRPPYYARILATLRQIIPFFVDFVLKEESGTVFLQWAERGSQVTFGAHQASDGMLRTMALVTLLLQPPEEIPNLIILDEPELGLHPFALNIIAGLARAASQHTQIILATQSTTLIDHFEPSEVLVVDRENRESTMKRLEEDKLAEWLSEYSLGELWEKNVIGGRPGR